MQFTDRLTLDAGIRRTRDGYGVVAARVARAGNVQTYLGAEMGITDKQVVRVYRPADEVFRKDAVKTYAGVPVTLGHPIDPVNSANWKDLAIGEVGDDVLRDGDFIRVPLILRDEAAIKAIDGGTRELSMGYEAKIVMQDGVTPSGERYDAIMRDFRMNHLAVVEKARGGSELRIGDADHWGLRPIPTADERKPDMPDNLRTVVVDGLSVATTDQGAQAIEKLTNDRATAQAALADEVKKYTDTVAAKDAEIGALKVELQKAKDAVPNGAALDKLVADRSALVDAARKISADIKVDGVSDADIRKAAVTAKFGDAMVANASDAEIAGMFKAAMSDSKAVADPVRQALARDANAARKDAGDNGQAAYEKRLQDGWKTKAA